MRWRWTRTKLIIVSDNTQFTSRRSGCVIESS